MVGPWWRATREGEGRELAQGPVIDLAFEENNIGERMPPRDPPPVIELGMIHCVESDHVFRNSELKQEPYLLLANTAWFSPTSLVPLRKPVMKPVAGSPQHLNMRVLETQFLMQLPVQGLFRRLAHVNTALRKLPTTVFQATRPQDITSMPLYDHAHVGAKTLCVDSSGNAFHGAWEQPPPEGSTGRQPGSKLFGSIPRTYRAWTVPLPKLRSTDEARRD